jgi:hypothetical protein
MNGLVKLEKPEPTSHSNSLVYYDEVWVILVIQNCVMTPDPRYRFQLRITGGVEEYSFSDKTLKLNLKAFNHR